MITLFKKKSKKELMNKKYKKLLQEGFKLSKINRKESDSKYAEADELLKKMESL